MKSNKRRIYYLDVLRVLGCIAVIMIHVSASFVKNEPVGSMNFWVADVLNGSARFAVPIFVMISGALLLDERYHYTNKKLVEHIKRLGVIFIFWSFIYVLVFQIIGKLVAHESINWIHSLGSLIGGHYHLWFLYLIIGLYLILPLLRLWVTKKNEKYVRYFIGLSLIFAFILPQIVEIGSNYNSAFDVLNSILYKKLYLNYVGGYTTYFLLGWYLNNYVIKNKKLVYMLGLLGVLATIVGTYVFSIVAGKLVLLDNNLSLNILFPSVALFVFVRNKYINMEAKRGIVNRIADNSLGVYVAHILFVRLFYAILDAVGCGNVAIVRIPIVFIGTFVCSMLLTSVIRKVPGLRRVV
ncbi:acyltransferase family protein [Candidatus Saccharibacteria bacterium]|nr:acyltransferase family protein [Candidatus Saccharibacteria bacterium]